jgi:2-amino-4-hydroxy-6-hydroxymethyldihydropteridine diphosphokinase
MITDATIIASIEAKNILKNCFITKRVMCVNETKLPFLYLRATMAEQVYLLLGSNEGDREAYLSQAVNAIQETIAAGKVKTSAIYETAAWGIEEQPSFLNMAVGLETNLQPLDVLQAIRDIEKNLGRQRIIVWGQRTLDIDILLFGSRIIDTDELIIPHPRLQDRRFALGPLSEIAGGLTHPLLGKTIDALLAECTDSLAIVRIG